MQALKLLEKLPGWVWDKKEAQWENGFQKLVAYTNTHKTSLVPKSFKDDDGFKLGSWVRTQRTRFKNGTLSVAERQKLEALDKWAWTLARN